MPKFHTAYNIVKYKGLGFCAYRASYGLHKKLGLLKRKCPAGKWSQITLADLLRPSVYPRSEAFLEGHKANGRCFFFKPGELPQPGPAAIAAAEEVLQNKFQYFFDKWHSLGDGPDWFLNPVTKQRADSDVHWCDVNTFDPRVGDIKFIWEPSRFAWVYTLVRAFASTGDNKYAEKFWQLLESWLHANQPNTGPNYVCGQECAIRLMAMCFALYGMWEANASTVERKLKLVTAIGVHAGRIEKNIAFAISTQTNHSLTEAAGLYTTGILFPEFKRSARWVKLGKKVLTREGLKQIRPDGSYIQHSMNYHRLMLQDFLWAMRLAELNEDSFGEKLVSRVRRAVEFLYQLQDDSGRVPNYGPNDGALIVPLNNCGYLDYRGVLQATNYLLNKARLYDPGPWDEDTLWLFGPEAMRSPITPARRESKAYASRGYYSLRNKDSWAMMRCHSFTERPSHADMLHLDMWWKGQNILRDSGTYMYTCDEPWESYFPSTAAHNTITVDGADQMTRASRFMWFDWTKAKLTAYNSGNGSKLMQGEHYGYRSKGRNLVHRRAVLSQVEDRWIIVDDLLGSGKHELELFWQVCDSNYQLSDNQLTLDTQAGAVSLAVMAGGNEISCKCFRGDDKPFGWQSLYYGVRSPAPVLVCSTCAELPVRFVTFLCLGEAIKETELNQVKLEFCGEHKRKLDSASSAE
ncbi:MAG: heparinase [Actinobacteria bacterium]|nr:heparinase [Actinomycetota bacterium]